MFLVPLVVSSRQRLAGGRLPADLVFFLHHVVAQRDEVALQDDQTLAEALSRQGAFGHLSRELLLVLNKHQQTVLQLRLICAYKNKGSNKKESSLQNYCLTTVTLVLMHLNDLGRKI